MMKLGESTATDRDWGGYDSADAQIFERAESYHRTNSPEVVLVEIGMLWVVCDLAGRLVALGIFDMRQKTFLVAKAGSA